MSDPKPNESRLLIITFIATLLFATTSLLTWLDNENLREYNEGLVALNNRTQSEVDRLRSELDSAHRVQDAQYHSYRQLSKANRSLIEERDGLQEDLLIITSMQSDHDTEKNDYLERIMSASESKARFTTNAANARFQNIMLDYELKTKTLPSELSPDYLFLWNGNQLKLYEPDLPAAKEALPPSERIKVMTPIEAHALNRKVYRGEIDTYAYFCMEQDDWFASVGWVISTLDHSLTTRKILLDTRAYYRENDLIHQQPRGPR